MLKSEALSEEFKIPSLLVFFKGGFLLFIIVRLLSAVNFLFGFRSIFRNDTPIRCLICLSVLEQKGFSWEEGVERGLLFQSIIDIRDQNENHVLREYIILAMSSGRYHVKLCFGLSVAAYTASIDSLDCLSDLPHLTPSTASRIQPARGVVYQSSSNGSNGVS